LQRPNKRSGKGKEKKLVRKQVSNPICLPSSIDSDFLPFQELEKEAASKAIIDAAYKVPNQLDFAPLFRSYSKLGAEYDIEFHRVADLGEETLAWCLDLTSRNMKELYSATWGWDERKKKRELGDELALYLVVFTRDDHRPVAFAHFRFLFEEDKAADVLYLYEIQTETDYQGKGIGRFLMVILQLLAAKNKMKHIMMTVFKSARFTFEFRKNRIR
jgi:GNAT superfamily N-acetyltransferase